MLNIKIGFALMFCLVFDNQGLSNDVVVNDELSYIENEILGEEYSIAENENIVSLSNAWIVNYFHIKIGAIGRMKLVEVVDLEVMPYVEIYFRRKSAKR